MNRFSVWAPQRKTVSVHVGGSVLPLIGPDDRGWWSLDHPTAAHGTDYAFRVDDDEADYPDPRSPWQPEGVHKTSRVYDHSLFQWSDKNFQPTPLASAILYEMHVGTFTPEGTFDAAIEHLDYLVDLGITHVELLPIASFEGHHGWGYDGVALYAPHEPYGGPDAAKRFVDACHKRGLAVLLDVVYNHFGPTGNYTGIFGQYLNEHHHTPWGAAINFESTGADQSRRFFVDNVLLWLRDYHFDGLRLDAIHEFVDRSAIHILEQMSSEVEDLSAAMGKKLVLIGESDLNDPRVVTPRAANGLGLEAQWSDDFHHALFSVITGEQAGYYVDYGDLDDLAKSLECVFVFDGKYARNRSRDHGRPVAGLSFHRFLGYIQNHDQVGNRAKGDRLTDIVSFECAQIAAAIVLTAPFVPMLFQGEEWAASTPFQYFADHQDPELRKNVAEGRKREFAAFGWKPEDVPNPEEPAAFEVSKLKWDEVKQAPHSTMLAWYRDLIRLRRSTHDLNRGEYGSVSVKIRPEARTIEIARHRVMTLVNLGETTQTFKLDSPATILLANRDGLDLQPGMVTLPPGTVVILEFKQGLS
ncbi:malto-oligosyltrehalose trehalohydrolase [Terriglobus saanensis]|uniref:Malto-oligosyltrehalose trehalohydrolase n=1 Tax=Terriglobus saanensis (strain ATCC BAA-1853 / DSM 23119 / SP1PR4) TaxID=401053 RepID=E8UY06_TERSS|nr:malto-oligosyltrehalose trehalohydrolase [Terriglobus saanensis]ADV84240.1 malto-oligosyltrehalose trehalohydrolase [Terriglobus saanensis SP1PR4]